MQLKNSKPKKHRSNKKSIKLQKLHKSQGLKYFIVMFYMISLILLIPKHDKAIGMTGTSKQLTCTSTIARRVNSYSMHFSIISVVCEKVL